MSVKLTSYIRPECILEGSAERTRAEALNAIVHAAAERGLLEDEEQVLSRLMERENVQSTAVGNGIAIPHCFAEGIAALVIMVALFPAGVDFDSMDGKPTRVVFLVLGDRRDYDLHLKAIARIARLTRNPAFIGKMVGSDSAREMMRAFHEEEARLD